MSSLIRELFRLKPYKNTQGRLVRRLTMMAIMVMFAAGAYKFFKIDFYEWPILGDPIARFAIACVIIAAGSWFAFRLVNWPSFADFLVSVESEMVKVSWPSKAELYSSTLVVLVMFVLLSAMIYMFDAVWVTIFTWLGLF
ncbi:MAG: preprotein translocase subunit SecE [Thermoguttaceae bacterium]